jgi:hypothetical protein
LRKLPPLGSDAPLTPLVGASGSVAGRQFIPSRSNGKTFDLMERFGKAKPARWVIGGPRANADI